MKTFANLLLGFNFSLVDLPTLVQPKDEPLLDNVVMSERERGGRLVFHIHRQRFLASLNNSNYCLEWHEQDLLLKETLMNGESFLTWIIEEAAE